MAGFCYNKKKIEWLHKRPILKTNICTLDQFFTDSIRLSFCKLREKNIILKFTLVIKKKKCNKIKDSMALYSNPVFQF